MDPAISTLIGTALGGLIGAGSGFSLERFRAKQNRDMREREIRLAARRAARLIAEELKRDEQRVRTAVEKGYYTWAPKEPLETTAWDEVRADFAESAGSQAWDQVADAYAELDRLNSHLLLVIHEDDWTGVPPPHPLEERDLDPNAKRYAKRAIPLLASALTALQALMAVEL